MRWPNKMGIHASHPTSGVGAPPMDRRTSGSTPDQPGHHDTAIGGLMEQIVSGRPPPSGVG
jgi:hypothetical protein